MILEPLPQGITGFFEGDGALPGTDPRLFARACHEAAREACTSARMVGDSGRAVSYFAAIFDMAVTPIAVLCNRVYPCLGFLPGAALTHPGPAYLNDAALGHALAKWGDFRLLNADLLNADLQPEMLEALAPCELSQIRYWKPKRVGDVIFNSWD